QNELRQYLRRADVEAYTRVAREAAAGAGAHLDPGVEARRRARQARIADDVAAAEVAALDAGEVHGDALAVPRLGQRDAVHLEPAHARLVAVRQDADRVALADRARDGRAGDHDPVPAHHEGAVDRQAKRSRRRCRHRQRQLAGDLAPEVVQPGAG